MGLNRDRLARWMTVAVLLIVLGVVFGSKMNWRTPLIAATAASQPVTAQDTIYAMLDAARSGDVPKYLNCFSGSMDAALRQSLAESGEAGFANYLRSTQAQVKGVALNEPQPLTEREVKVRVEYVFQDRNEIQLMNLEKFAAGWKITRLESAERVKTLVPYGTPVQ